jgi:hypothetical protein
MRNQIEDTWSFWDNSTRSKRQLHYTIVTKNDKVTMVFNQHNDDWSNSIAEGSEIFNYFKEKYNK